MRGPGPLHGLGDRRDVFRDAARARGHGAIEGAEVRGRLAYEQFHRIGGRLRREIEAQGKRYGFSAQTPGEDAVFGVRFTDRRPLHTWADLLTSDKALNLRWSIELLKRGILVNPNEKFYISTAHTDADVDRTLEACEQAFAAIRGQASRQAPDSRGRFEVAGAARTRDVVYLGGAVRYTVRVAGDEIVFVEEPHSPGRPVLSPGSVVRIEFDPAHCRLFAGE